MREARLALRTLLIAGAVVAALGLGATAALADDWGQRVPGQHVYDQAGALTAAETANLEQAAAAVDQAGAPTVVYLRRRDASDATARQDARALMDAWAVESSAGRKDGFVLLLDLRPSDSKHGSAALVAGESHADRLSTDRLQGVYDETMKPRLAAGDMAGALAAALGQVAADLKGPAPRQSPSPGLTAGLLLGLGGVVAAGIGVILLLAHGGGSRRPGGPSPYAGGQFPHGYTGSSSTFTGGDGGASSGSSSGGGSF